MNLLLTPFQPVGAQTGSLPQGARALPHSALEELAWLGHCSGLSTVAFQAEWHPAWGSSRTPSTVQTSTPLGGLERLRTPPTHLLGADQLLCPHTAGLPLTSPHSCCSQTRCCGCVPWQEWKRRARAQPCQPRPLGGPKELPTPPSPQVMQPYLCHKVALPSRLCIGSRSCP